MSSSNGTGPGRLAGKVAIVTGGAMGQGAGICRAFVAEGARTVIADVADEQGAALAAELEVSHPGMARFAHHDVSDEESWTALVADTSEQWGPDSMLAHGTLELSA